MNNNNWPKKPCLAPLTSVMVKPNGRLRPCCWWWQEGNDPSITDTSIIDYKQGFLKDLYDKMEAGDWPDGCKRCNTKAQSRYHYYEEKYSNYRDQEPLSVPIKTMDLRFGNLCNASCITCNITNSDYFEKVKKQGYFLTEDHYITDDQRRNHIQANMDWHNNPEAKKQILSNLEDVDLLYVTGGEPTINPTFHEVLKHLIDNGRAGEVTIELNTNGTNLNGKFLELLDPFKKIVLFSVDGYGELNDAMRFPTKFSAVEKNILEFKKIAKEDDFIMITPTIAVFNFFKMPELIQWARENRINIPERLNILSRPHWQNLTMLPQDEFQMGLSKLSEMVPRQTQELVTRIANKSSYRQDPVISYYGENGVLDLTRKWFTSRGYDPKITGMPGI